MNTTIESQENRCSICQRIFVLGVNITWQYGNNAQPVNNGRCCDKCDSEIVIPARCRQMGIPESAALAAGLLAHYKPNEPETTTESD
jgi:hypothetical protein